MSCILHADLPAPGTCIRYTYPHTCVCITQIHWILYNYTSTYMLQDHDRDSAKGEKPTEGLAWVQILSLQDAPLRRKSDGRAFVRGARGTRRVVMTAGERGGSVSQAWSSDLGSISITRKGNRAGTGSTSLSHTHTYTYITYTYSRHTHSRCDPSLSYIYIYK